ncbi:hypothetical protein MACJ_002901 [Theileria orientalis]|uniref:Uncharacterized protein n=1 Tax=Theileria orientalis TaxID=68886 RepID=A0A976M6X6_THEOR|nr:hypothetical protein MACJ_002901 [Theileria orientalis]
MGQNPTLQVGRISKCQKMEMAMESIRRTQKLGDKPWIKYNKVPKRVFDKEKVNVFMKLCLSTKKSVTPRNHTTKQDPLENVNYNKQLEELDILVDIIKKTGNVGRPENYMPLVHVPLPREFYELKPLVSFKSIAKKSQKRYSGSLHDAAHNPDSRSIFRDVPTDHVYGEPKRLYSELAPSTKTYSQDYVKLVTRKQEETRVDKSTSISSRPRDTLDKSTSIGSRPRDRLDKSTSISSSQRDRLDKSTITRSVTLNVPEEDDNGDMVAVKYDLKSEDTVIVLTPQRVLQKVDKAELLPERGILREMSTISSNPFDNQLSTYPSFDSLQFGELQPDVVDATDLYLIDNSWAAIEPVADPLKKARQVKAQHSSRVSKEMQTVELPSKEYQVEVLAEEMKTEAKLDSYTEQIVTLVDKYNDEVETKRYNTLEDESVADAPHEPLESKPEDKELAPAVQYKEELESKKAVEDAEKDEPKSHDEPEYQKYEYDEHEVDESMEYKESDTKKVTYSEEVPELNLKSTKLYNEKCLEAMALEEVEKHVDLELHDEFNKVESELFEVMESGDIQFEEKGAESVEELSEEIVDHQPVLQQLEAGKQSEQSGTKSDKQTGSQEHEQRQAVQSDEQPEVPLAIADKPRRRRARSHKRSKKSVPGVQLSDYKGFYVVHATNDWSLA